LLSTLLIACNLPFKAQSNAVDLNNKNTVLKMIKRMLVLAVACALPSISYGEQDANSGNSFKDLCARTAASGSCIFWVIGLQNGLIAGYVLSGSQDAYDVAQRKIGYCLPKGVTSGQQTAVFEKYLGDHPESLHEDAQFLAIRSWREAWPCPK